MHDTEAHRKLDAILRRLDAIEAAMHPCDMYLTDTRGSECRRPAIMQAPSGVWLCEQHASHDLARAPETKPEERP